VRDNFALQVFKVAQFRLIVSGSGFPSKSKTKKIESDGFELFASPLNSLL